MKRRMVEYIIYYLHFGYAKTNLYIMVFYCRLDILLINTYAALHYLLYLPIVDIHFLYGNLIQL